ncbi:HAD family hydrolase [Streptomyces fulvoviolaceus]|nr:HAD family hydrolase [Streptomyces fulvoviolaceus]MCT9081072.1 HAD family hydrolase [Streptomyces fulvoviolaceus]
MQSRLIMLDLDNTLVDRDAAFREAAIGFLAEHALPEGDLAWLTGLDGSGYTPRQDVARAMSERYGLPTGVIGHLLDHGVAEHVVLAEATRDALRTASDGGWTCVIVTNGRVAQQETKIRNTGLDRLVHGWVVSEGVGHKKPAPEIFHAAAAAVGASLDGAWVIGDAAHADIRGALEIGARSVWVAGGQAWPEPGFRPTHIAQDAASAIRYVTST